MKKKFKITLHLKYQVGAKYFVAIKLHRRYFFFWYRELRLSILTMDQFNKVLAGKSRYVLLDYYKLPESITDVFLVNNNIETKM